jgi:hypothetical protein
VAGLKVEALTGVFPAVVAELGRSHALVDRVYELEPKLPAVADRFQKLGVAPELQEFEQERFRTAVGFIATLYLTAWEKSAQVAVPDWVKPSAGEAAGR